MPHHPFRFGVVAETFNTAEDWRALACRVEALGYDTLLIRDHLVSDVFGRQLAPLVALMAAADATTTLRVGTLVIGNDFRHPTVLAKEAATLDLLSGGRFELGLGAGWMRAEYDRAGLRYDRNGVRVDRLEESIAILKACLAGGQVTFTGEHYRLDGFEPWPLPVQRPHLPLLIGAGAPRMLAMAGRHADIVSILTTSVNTGTVTDDPALRRSAVLDERIGYIRSGAGDRFAEIELSLVPNIHITDDRHGEAERLIAEHRWANTSVADVFDMPAIYIGTIDEIRAQMVDRRDRHGISYYALDDAAMEAAAPIVERLRGT